MGDVPKFASVLHIAFSYGFSQPKKDLTCWIIESAQKMSTAQTLVLPQHATVLCLHVSKKVFNRQQLFH